MTNKKRAYTIALMRREGKMENNFRDWFVRIPAGGSVTTYTGIVIENQCNKAIRIKVKTPITEEYEKMREEHYENIQRK